MADDTTSAEDKADPAAIVRQWKAEIRLAEKEFKPWWDRGDKIVKRYRDERRDGDKGRRFNVLWSNVEVMRPSLFARTPKTDIERRWKDQDPVGRMAAETLQRAVSYSLSSYDFTGVMQNVVTDYLLPGRGTVWIRYVPHFKDVTPRVPVIAEPPAVQDLGVGIGGPVDGLDEQRETHRTLDGTAVDSSLVQTGDDGSLYMDGDPYKAVVFEETVADYLYWKDFLHNPARTADELRWCARKAYLTRDELVDRFGEIGRDVQLDFNPAGSSSAGARSTPEDDALKKATVYEIWDKTKRQAVWIAEKLNDKPLEVRDDPLRLKDFFPCPRPLLATTTTDSMVPIPDYAQYQDQAEELDTITERIGYLTRALKVVGVYDGAVKSNMQRLLQDGVENELIMIDDWAMFAEKGGMKGVIDWLPIQVVAEVLERLIKVREQVKKDLYEISGMADIMRGDSDPRTTATAERIKGRFGAMRLQERQREVQRFVRDIVQLVSEVISEHFQPATIALMAGVQTMGADAQYFDEAVKLLRNDALRSFRIDIETDSMLEIEEGEDRQDRINFVKAVGAFLQQALPIMQQVPAIAPLLGQTLLFTVRGFRVGRPLEASFEQAIAGLEAEGQKPPQPPPEHAAAQAEAENAQARVQIDRERQAAEFQLAQQKAQEQIALDAHETQAELAMERERTDHQIQLETQRHINKTTADLVKAAAPIAPIQTAVRPPAMGM